MIYFLEKSIKENKKLKLELKKFYGLNNNSIKFLLNFLGINSITKTKFINKNIMLKLKQKINSNFIIESRLKRQKNNNLSNKLNIKTIKSLRYLSGLPVNGQRTKTNAKTTKKLSFKKK